jgi:hypothetical protein
MTETNSTLNFSDADLQAALRRALRLSLILGLAIGCLLTLLAGWRTGVMFVAGAVVSMTGLYEWRELIALLNAKLDKQKSPKSTGWVVTMFFLRLGFAALVVYVSLKCSRGSPYALLAGLGLAVFTLTIEAIRLIRS